MQDINTDMREASTWWCNDWCLGGDMLFPGYISVKGMFSTSSYLGGGHRQDMIITSCYRQDRAVDGHPAERLVRHRSAPTTQLCITRVPTGEQQAVWNSDVWCTHLSQRTCIGSSCVPAMECIPYNAHISMNTGVWSEWPILEEGTWNIGKHQDRGADSM